MMVNSFKVAFLFSLYNFGSNVVEGGPVPPNMQRSNGALGSMPPNMNFGGMGAAGPFGSGQPRFNGAGGMSHNMYGGMGGMNPFGSNQLGFNGAVGVSPSMQGGMGVVNLPGSSQPGVNLQASAGPQNSQLSAVINPGVPLEGGYGGEDDIVGSTFGLGSLIYSTTSIPYLLVSPIFSGFASIFS